MLLASGVLFFFCLHPLQPSEDDQYTLADSLPTNATPGTVAHCLNTSRHRFAKQGFVERTQYLNPLRLPMNSIDLVVLSLHPIVALFAIIWIMRQRRKHRSSLLSNEIKNHFLIMNFEDYRKKTYSIAWILVVTGFLANLVYSLRTDEMEIIQAIFPSGVGGLHAGGGVIGLLFLTYFKQRDKNKLTIPKDTTISDGSKNSSKYDIIMLLIIIHAFLGFLWLLDLIS